VPNTFNIPLTGIGEIDTQHAQLMDCLARLQHYVETGYTFSAAFDAVQTLQQYVATHFQCEEEFLTSHNYPKLAEHIEEHRKLTARLKELTAEILEGEDISRPLLVMMTEWITTHISLEDIEFAKYFGTVGHPSVKSELADVA
jgi:hemerythrin